MSNGYLESKGGVSVGKKLRGENEEKHFQVTYFKQTLTYFK